MENTEVAKENEKHKLSSDSFEKIQNDNIDESIFDDSLTYIPVYTHLITYDPVPIKRPVTPLIIKSLQVESRAESEITKTPELKSSCQFDKSSKIEEKK